MGRRRREAGGDERRPTLNAPFADLRRKLAAYPTPRARPAPQPPAPQPPAPQPRAPEPDPFESAMAGVVPLRGSGRRVDRPAPAGDGRRPVSDEAEALAMLSDLVDGSAVFDVTDTREYVEGAIVGLDPRVLRRLRR